VNWEPTAEDIQNKLIEMAYRWGDIEAVLAERSLPGAGLADVESDDYPAMAKAMEFNEAHHVVNAAFRVEAVYDENEFGDPCSVYVLLYDVTDEAARNAANQALKNQRLLELIRDMARPWHTRDFLYIKSVAGSVPVEGQICRRFGEKHPKGVQPSLEDVPTFRPDGSVVPLEQRGPYHLTPIEAQFYDALAETGLTFSVQPWIQHADKKHRSDFFVFYDGGVVCVELDGHDFHKTKEQRGSDATKDRWLQARGMRTVRFTGSQVFADAAGCIRELHDVVRQSQARP
jgi:very-short-patch-repair endonuclease